MCHLKKDKGGNADTLCTRPDASAGKQLDSMQQRTTTKHIRNTKKTITSSDPLPPYTPPTSHSPFPPAPPTPSPPPLRHPQVPHTRPPISALNPRPTLPNTHSATRLPPLL